MDVTIVVLQKIICGLNFCRTQPVSTTDNLHNNYLYSWVYFSRKKSTTKTANNNPLQKIPAILYFDVFTTLHNHRDLEYIKATNKISTQFDSELAAFNLANFKSVMLCHIWPTWLTTLAWYVVSIQLVKAR